MIHVRDVPPDPVAELVAVIGYVLAVLVVIVLATAGTVAVLDARDRRRRRYPPVAEARHHPGMTIVDAADRVAADLTATMHADGSLPDDVVIVYESTPLFPHRT